ncbi:GDSL-type esterase/lipase family protein [Sabulicella glaciei]|uniref:GDSL-type esterase/lipase family protein n=1 Tax=Sabulicella glaciei TaxID=2984948 RepID=A0ABT3P2A2_9PROT|nr:GDSL-type esterase/lipase family protein [Roseococcus sp. MDT2-1-1]MCW8088313.1 GDSL-type esterase/lipase family protein [Roseococcus sp. MDT2-1-1]
MKFLSAVIAAILLGANGASATGLACGALLAGPPSAAIQPRERVADNAYRHRGEMLQRLARDQVSDLVFIGDSITMRWHRPTWASLFEAYRPLNLGMSGDQTENVLWRLQNGHLPRLQPRLYVLLIGTNNPHPAREVAAGVAMIVQFLRQTSPNSHVLVLGVLPRGADPRNSGRAKNAAVNALIRTCADNVYVHFLDVSADFVEPDGTISAETMPDGLHLSPASYERLGQAIYPTIRHLMALPRASLRQ